MFTLQSDAGRNGSYARRQGQGRSPKSMTVNIHQKATLRYKLLLYNKSLKVWSVGSSPRVTGR
jgi:hypothetical protein